MSKPGPLQSTGIMRAATLLLGLFLVAIVVAFGLTISQVPGARGVAAVSVVPIIVLTGIFIVYARRGRLWAFAGGSALGLVGIALRLAVSTEPGLEVGGGLPADVDAFYILLGAAVAIANLLAVLDLRHKP